MIRVSAATNIEDCKRRRKLFVGQLPDSISEEQLRLLFVKFGHIIQLKIKRDHENDDSMCDFSIIIIIIIRIRIIRRYQCWKCQCQ